MSFTTWAPHPVLVEASARQGGVWRIVEAQHVASTMKIADSHAEQAVLEELLEQSKPARPASAELGYHRWKFLHDAVALEKLEPVAHPAFRVEIHAPTVDLRKPPFNVDAAACLHPVDYQATLAFARTKPRAALQTWWLAVHTKEITMSIEANKALVTRFWQAFSAGKYEEVLGMLADDATWWVAGTTALSRTYSKTEFRGLLDQIVPMAPKGLRVTPKGLTAEADRVSVEAESYAEFTNGRTYQNIYHFMMVVRDGKFSAIREYLDTEHVTATFAP